MNLSHVIANLMYSLVHLFRVFIIISFRDWLWFNFLNYVKYKSEFKIKTIKQGVLNFQEAEFLLPLQVTYLFGFA